MYSSTKKNFGDLNVYLNSEYVCLNWKCVPFSAMMAEYSTSFCQKNPCEKKNKKTVIFQAIFHAGQQSILPLFFTKQTKKPPQWKTTFNVRSIYKLLERSAKSHSEARKTFEVYQEQDTLKYSKALIESHWPSWRTPAGKCSLKSSYMFSVSMSIQYDSIQQ